jgi:O-6-methylguanine DNA methyltransferase
MLTVYVEKAGGTWFGVTFNGECILATGFGPNEKSVIQSLRENTTSNTPFQRLDKPTPFAQRVIDTLKNVYEGKDVSQNFSFETQRLSNYSKRIIETVCLIPPGYVASYGGVAKATGGGPRAVGRVMASNPFAPLCPCHRVVASDFTLCGYGGGLNVKREFLKRERRGYSAKKNINTSNGKLELFPVEFVVDKAEKKNLN